MSSVGLNNWPEKVPEKSSTMGPTVALKYFRIGPKLLKHEQDKK